MFLQVSVCPQRGEACVTGGVHVTQPTPLPPDNARYGDEVNEWAARILLE